MTQSSVVIRYGARQATIYDCVRRNIPKGADEVPKLASGHETTGPNVGLLRTQVLGPQSVAPVWAQFIKASSRI